MPTTRAAGMTAVQLVQPLPEFVPTPNSEEHPDIPGSAWLRYGDLQIVILPDGQFADPDQVEPFKAAAIERFRPAPQEVTAYVPMTLFDVGARGQAVWDVPAKFGTLLPTMRVRIVPEPEEVQG